MDHQASANINFLCRARRCLLISLGSPFPEIFFATSHGKGPVYGIGGCLKRIATDRVRTKQSVINYAADFYQAVKGSAINATLISSEEVQQQEVLLRLPELFESTAPIKGALDFNWVELIDGHVSTRRYGSEMEAINRHDDGSGASSVDSDSAQNGIAQAIESQCYAVFWELVTTGLLVVQ